MVFKKFAIHCRKFLPFLCSLEGKSRCLHFISQISQTNLPAPHTCLCVCMCVCPTVTVSPQQGESPALLQSGLIWSDVRLRTPCLFSLALGISARRWEKVLNADMALAQKYRCTATGSFKEKSRSCNRHVWYDTEREWARVEGQVVFSNVAL